MSNSRLILSANEIAITHELRLQVAEQACRCGFAPTKWVRLDNASHQTVAWQVCLDGEGSWQRKWKNSKGKRGIPRGIDCNVIPEGLSSRLPQLAVLDMDSTLISIECIDELAKAAGSGEEVSAITAAAMAGELDFAESFTKRLATLQGLPISVVEELASNLPLKPGVEAAIQDLHTWGCKIVIASGGFTHMAHALGKRLGAHHVVANQLEVADGLLTGKHIGDIVTGETKQQVLLERASAWGIPLNRTVAVGDGANDLPMISAAGNGIAAHAKPKVRELSPLGINNTGLEVMRYLFGWSDDAMK
jgi:phosphoserine phosphatase